ncbi:SDR family NAD(P)-dependent oxidoreductase [Petropleomorpha daqingensis]|uniref:3-oxoacyl-[acyl-carrier protein] reductase n=1 Tax=Petropleomorpha daqingensis TaxID=2026353 RepID=A0A853CHY2_9ACTN|nr:SDR family oxidoreductase [Petropleomorpha daqingensis]NYJ06876.1 3-oxoacyl-[acyl-carrier protein] reductase [Petropleomorpha daqingensis]
MSEFAATLTGRVAVVTGTAQGIGQAVARGIRDAGGTVHEVDRDDVDLSVARAVEEFFAGIGDVDVLVNVAGGVVGQTHVPIDELTDEAWDAVVDANLRTTMNCTRAAARSMKRRGFGRIVNISSGAGRSVSLTGIQAYASAKAAQIGFTRQLAHELGPFGITVNCIAPGFVLSNPTTQRQWESYGEEGQRALLERIPVRALGSPDDIARGVLFFVSPAAGWVSGQTLSIDGGHSLF